VVVEKRIYARGRYKLKFSYRPDEILHHATTVINTKVMRCIQITFWHLLFVVTLYVHLL